MFVDLEQSIVDYVVVWPRFNDVNGYGYYESMEVYADSVLCPSEQIYNPDKIANVLKPKNQAMVFTCPKGTSASTIQLKNGDDVYVHLSEIEVFTVPTQLKFAKLMNPRFANFDASQPNGQGVIVDSWNEESIGGSHYPVENAIDENRGLNGNDQAAHPERVSTGANFFVDFEKSIVDYVRVWPRFNDPYEYGTTYYEGMELYIRDR